MKTKKILTLEKLSVCKLNNYSEVRGGGISGGHTRRPTKVKKRLPTER